MPNTEANEKLHELELELVDVDKEVTHLEAVTRGKEKDTRFDFDPTAAGRELMNALGRRERLRNQRDELKERIETASSIGIAARRFTFRVVEGPSSYLCALVDGARVFSLGRRLPSDLLRA